MKTLGIIGGLGPESSALFYQILNRTVRQRLGGRHSARLLLDSLDYHDFALTQERDDWDAAAALLVASARRLERGGADLLVLACNTAHRVASDVEAAVAIPFLHIVDPAGEALRRDGRRRVALLGTRQTMEGSFYGVRLRARYGVEAIVPDADGRSRVHATIQDELVHGIVRPESRDAIAAVTRRLADRGADAVLLACTELSLLISGEEKGDGLPLPCYDGTRLHAVSAVERALATWGGGRTRSDAGRPLLP